MDVIMVWAWMHWPTEGLVAWTWPTDGLAACTLSWFGHGCTGQWMGWVGSMGVVMVGAWIHWPMDGLVAWTLSWFGQGSVHWMDWQHGCYHGLGMDALANGWVGSMDVIMVWAWIHWPMDGLVAWALSWFGQGSVAWQHGCYHGLGMDALANGWVGSMDVIMVWAGISARDGLAAWMLSWLGCMDALANGWVGSMDVITVWVWMHWPTDGLVAWTLSWLGHGYTGQWMGW